MTQLAGHPADAADWRPPAAVRWLTLGFGAVACMLAGALLTLIAAPHLTAIQHTATTARPPAVSAAATGATREFTLEAKEVDWELFPGTMVKAWTFNGTVPGPEIRVTEGDLVRVTLRNALPEPTTIHWHGVDVPNAMDGIPGMTQDAVPPGGTFTYEFIATNPGTRWYHSHQDPELQIPLGLFGSLIVEPKTPPQGAVKYDRDYTYMLSEWSLALTPDVVTGAATLPSSGPGAPHSKEPDFDLFLMNGHANEDVPPILVKSGEKVRIRLINAGSLVHVMHTHGHSFKIIAQDGNFIPPAQQLVKDSVTIGPSERVDLELVASNPGVWMFHCHIEHHMANGMMTTIQYEGVAPPVAMAGMDHSAAPPAQTIASVTSLPAIADVPGSATQVAITDNRFTPTTLSVAAGTTVAWLNKGTNLHTVSSLDGLFDSGSIPPGKAFVYKFDKPGVYRILCRQHFLSGMSATITVT